MNLLRLFILPNFINFVLLICLVEQIIELDMENLRQFFCEMDFYANDVPTNVKYDRNTNWWYIGDWNSVILIMGGAKAKLYRVYARCHIFCLELFHTWKKEMGFGRLMASIKFTNFIMIESIVNTSFGTKVLVSHKTWGRPN